MIGSRKLVDVSRRAWVYGSREEGETGAPRGCGGLPEEWRAKVGRYSLPDVYVCEVGEVKLAGPALVGMRGDGDVILDTAFFGRVDLFERNYGQFDAARAAAWTQPAIYLDCALSLGSVWGWNYFHWVVDQLPKLEALEVYRFETGDTPVVIIGPDAPGYVVEWLRAMGVAFVTADQGQHFQVERLVVAQTRRKAGRVYESAVEFLRWLRAGVVDGERLANPMVYISREGTRARRVTNEDELGEALLAKGWALERPETCGAVEQAARFQGVEALAGAHGAGLANMVWMKQEGSKAPGHSGTKGGDQVIRQQGNRDAIRGALSSKDMQGGLQGGRVVELVAPQYTNPCCWLLGEACGVDYRYVVGEAVGVEDLRVDVGQVMEAIYG